MFDRFKTAAGNAWQKTKEIASNVADSIGKGCRKVAVACGIGAATVATASAQSTLVNDATDLITSAETTFETVGGVIILVLGFTLVVKFVKKLRGA